MIISDPVLLHKAHAPCIRQFRQRRPDSRRPFRNLQWHKVRLGEIAVIMRLFLTSHGKRDLPRLIKVARLLDNNTTAAQNILLAHYLK